MKTLFDVPKIDIMENDTKYSRAIKTPQYQIVGDKPLLAELFNNKKVIELLTEIRNSNVSDEEKHFLQLAAYRHCIFNYAKIAEYYPHASEEMQKLMEKSAVVIIDIDDAIHNGYVEYSKKLSSIIENSDKSGK